MSILKSGSTGPAVKLLQILLNNLGERLREDGVFGPRTEAALTAVQRRYQEAGESHGFIDGHLWRDDLEPGLGTLTEDWAACLGSLFAPGERGLLVVQRPVEEPILDGAQDHRD